MSKLPSFQFYPGDWLKDPELRMASLASRAIWFDLICAMWEASERGALEGTPEQFCRLVRCSADEFSLFMTEAKSLRFANVREMSADPQGVIRIECRRVLREEKQRKAWANQKKSQRERPESATSSDDCPPDVRKMSGQCPPSSSSSSSSSKKEKEKSKSPDRYEHWLDTVLIPAFPPQGRCQSKSALRFLQKTIPSEDDLAAFLQQAERWRPVWEEMVKNGVHPTGLLTFLTEGKYRVALMLPSMNGKAASSTRAPIPFADLRKQQGLL